MVATAVLGKYVVIVFIKRNGNVRIGFFKNKDM